LTWHGKASFIGNISAKKYHNPFMCVKVIASQRWDVIETRCSYNSITKMFSTVPRAPNFNILEAKGAA